MRATGTPYAGPECESCSEAAPRLEDMVQAWLAAAGDSVVARFAVRIERDLATVKDAPGPPGQTADGAFAVAAAAIRNAAQDFVSRDDK